MAKKQISMKIISEPEGGGMISTTKLPMIRGAGFVDYTCGACKVVLADSMKEGELDGCAFLCPTCGCCNRVAG
jgi:uncharacterized Zn finger protein (UPF0148 family)